MRILTYIRQVLDAEESVRVANNAVALENSQLVMDTMDEYGVEEALRLRETGAALPWTTTLEALDRVSRLIRDTTLELRMVPVEELFSRFPRVVRDLSVTFRQQTQHR